MFNQKKEAPDSLLNEMVINVNGAEIVVSTENHVIKPDQSIIKQSKTNYQVAADKRWLPVDYFTSISWSGIPTPKDREFSCLNPFRHHNYRPIYLEIDGFTTDQGNILCSECHEFNEKRKKIKKWMLWGLLYNPEIF